MDNLQPSQMMHIGGGLVIVIGSFLDWFGSGDFGINGWDTDQFGLLGILVALIVSGLVVILLAGKSGEAPPELELSTSRAQEPVVHRSQPLVAPGDVIASAETDSAPEMVARTIIEPRSDASPTIPSIGHMRAMWSHQPAGRPVIGRTRSPAR